MRVFIKNLIKIAGIAVLVGIVLMIVGLSMDNTIFERPEEFSYSLVGNNYGGKNDFWSSSNEEEKKKITKESDYKETASEEKVREEMEVSEEMEKSDDTKYENEIDEEEYENNLDFPISYKKVTSLELDILSGSVKINNNRYSGINSKELKNNGADNFFSLNCDIGKIDLSIR